MYTLGSRSWVQTALPSHFSSKVYAAHQRLLRDASSKKHQTGFITVFLKGTYTVLSLCQLMRMSYVGVKYFLT